MYLISKQLVAYAIITILFAGSIIAMEPMKPVSGQTGDMQGTGSSSSASSSGTFFRLMTAAGNSVELYQEATAIFKQLCASSKAKDIKTMTTIMASLGSSDKECRASCDKILDLLNRKVIDVGLHRDDQHYLNAFKLLLTMKGLVDKGSLPCAYTELIKYALNATYGLYDQNVALLASMISELCWRPLRSNYLEEQQRNFQRTIENLITRALSDLYAIPSTQERQRVAASLVDLLDPLKLAGLKSCAEELEKRINQIKRNTGRQFPTTYRSQQEEEDHAALEKEVEES